MERCPGRVEFVSEVRPGRAGPVVDPTAWVEVVATLGAWGPGVGYRPVLEQRLWRATARGRMRHTLAVVLHDPFGQLDDDTAVRETTELLRPITARRPLAPLSTAHAARYRAPSIGYLAELGEADPVLPEGGEAFGGLFTSLSEGLVAHPGPVALSMLVGPEPPSDPRWADPGPDPDERQVRRVEFRLRLFAETPLPAALLARAEALCLASAPRMDQWRIPLDRAELEAMRDAVVAGRITPHAGGPRSTVNSRTAALTLALVEPVGHGAVVDGRPFTGTLPRDGAPMGRIVRPDGRRADWRLSWDDRRLHVLLAGSSGCGKTTAVKRLALDDMSRGRSVVLIDPHGDVADEVAVAVGRERLVLVDPRRPGSDALDLLDPDPARAAAHLMSAVREVWPEEYAGPSWNRAVTLTLRGLAASEHLPRRATLADVERFVTDHDWRERLVAGIADPALRADLVHEGGVWRDDRGGPHGGPTWTQYLTGKFTSLTQGPGRALFTREPGRPLEEDLRRGSVVVVALPLGELGTATTRLIARMFLARLTSAVAAQGRVAPAERRPVAVFCDEAHLMTGQSLTGLFAQARKFATAVHVCVQAPSMLGRHLDEILTNTQVHLLGRLSAPQAEHLLDRAGSRTVRALPTLPRHHLVVLAEDHVPTDDPFVLTPIPPPTMVTAERAEAVERGGRAPAPPRAPRRASSRP